MDSQPTIVQQRYRRSVVLDSDYQTGQRGLRGYHVTPLVRASLERVIAGLAPEASARAFSVIGPYGSGKSAFALFLARYLAGDAAERQGLLAQQSASGGGGVDALRASPRLLPILVGGNNTALRGALMRAMASQVRALEPEAAICAQLSAAAEDEDLDPQEVARLIATAAAHIAATSAWDGLVLIIDELGQYLDYAARSGDERDLFVLQTIAEMCARSGAVPCLVVTILHQAFDRYAGRFGTARRSEWAKVQGRYIDLPFQEPASQMMRMVGYALQPEATSGDEEARRHWAERMAPLSEELGLRPVDIGPSEWQELLAQAYPLHPQVLVVLPTLFRQLAQNERSLFAFLAGQEPWGLQETLRQRAATGDDPIYRLPDLYRYVTGALGSSLLSQARGRRWAELEESLVRARDLDPDAQATLICIGTLNALGQEAAFRATSAHLAYALRDTPADPTISAAIETLASQVLILYRSHRGSYILFEGSDLDLDGLVRAAGQRLAGDVAVAELLARAAAVVPLVAHQFSYRTGAVRQFAVRFVGAEDLVQLPWPPQGDGEVIYVVPEHDEGLALAQAFVCRSERSSEANRLFVLPKSLQGVRSMAIEAAAIAHVLATEPQLEHDRVAKRELASRLAELEQALSTAIAHAYRPEASSWWWRGTSATLRNAHDLDALLSQACAATYPQTPLLWNELIMRQQLSTAGAKARRNLIELMLDYAHLPRLGMESYPPERSIYESLFAQTGLHRDDPEHGWRFGPPDTANDPARLSPAWQALEAFVATTDAEPRPLKALYSLLEAPPYGIKAGVAPLLFMAFYLAHAGELSLYEHGSYVAVPDITVFERLLRQPEKFMLRLSAVRGARVAVYQRLAKALAPQTLASQHAPALMEAVLPLLRIAYGLPEYAKYTARHLAPQTQAIRTALLEATAPDTLLFTTLPDACDLPPFGADEPVDPARVDVFFARLKAGLTELQAAYPALQAWMLATLQQAFKAQSMESDALRTELTERYRAIANLTSDTLIRALGVRLETANTGGGWVETVGALIGKKSLRQWRDTDRDAAQLQIADLGRRFREVEELAAAAGPLASEVRRVGVVDKAGDRSVIVRPRAWNEAMASLGAQVRAALAQAPGLAHHQRLEVVAEILGELMDQNREEPQ